MFKGKECDKYYSLQNDLTFKVPKKYKRKRKKKM